MSTQSRNPHDRPHELPSDAPGKPASRQPPGNNTGTDPEEAPDNEGQDIPKTGRGGGE